jgi:hypothetical protein
VYRSGHPDYPQMNPYDGRGVGSPLIMDARMRRVSMPPPARVPVPGMGERKATLNRPFVANLG